jgi:hypothetical protein
MHSRVERSSPFTAPERDLIRRELGLRFTTYPSIANGILLRTWRAGPQAGQPKLPPAIRSMLDRGLVELRPDSHRRLPCAFFTEAGVAALRELAEDRRALDPVRFAHVRRELGLDADSGRTVLVGESGLHESEGPEAT